MKIWLCSLLAILVCCSATAQTFQFTAIPDEDTARLEARFAKVANYLQGKLGVPVRYVPVKSYPASVAAFKNNQVQLAWFGGLSGVQARRAVPGSLAIAQGEEDQAFVTYFIANTSAGLKPSANFPEGLAGKTFTFGAKNSTSGRLMPEFYIRKHSGKTPEELFSRLGFSGDHSATIALVQSGSYQVGALNYKVWETELAEGKIDPKRVEVIWKTPTYPDYNWTIRGDVDKTFGAGFVEKVKKALLELKDKDLLDSFPRKAFIPATNQMYEPILETAKAIDLLDE